MKTPFLTIPIIAFFGAGGIVSAAQQKALRATVAVEDKQICFRRQYFRTLLQETLGSMPKEVIELIAKYGELPYGKCLQTFQNQPENGSQNPYALVVLSDTVCAYESEKGVCTIVDAQNGKTKVILVDTNDAIAAMIRLPDGNLALLLQAKNMICCLNWRTGKITYFPVLYQWIEGMACLSDGCLLVGVMVSSGVDQHKETELKLLAQGAQEGVQVMRDYRSESGILVLPKDKVVVVTQKNQIKILDFGSSRLQPSLIGQVERDDAYLRTHAVQLSENNFACVKGSRMAGADVIEVWNTEGHRIKEIKTPNTIHSLCALPGGFAVGTHDGYIEIRNTDSELFLRDWKAHTTIITVLAMVAGRLVSRSKNCAVKLWA
jgi:hypothetical protein